MSRLSSSPSGKDLIKSKFNIKYEIYIRKENIKYISFKKETYIDFITRKILRIKGEKYER
jgi:hypothetical protein